MKPLVSIVIPTFNREKYIEECILSALNQSYDNVEVIVIDNNSSDSSHIIINRLRESFTFQYIRNEENIGPVNNWIAGISQAKGYYLKILFSDDVLFPNAVNDLVEAVEKSEYPVGFAYGTILTGNTLETSRIIYGNKRETLNLKKYLNLLITNSAPVSPGAVLMKRTDAYESFTNRSGYISNEEYKNHGAGFDVYSLAYTLRDGNIALKIPNKTVFFRRHSESFTISNFNNKIGRAYSDIIGKLIDDNLSRTKSVVLISAHWIKHRIKKSEKISLNDYLILFGKSPGFFAKMTAFLMLLFIYIMQKVKGLF